jgi:hypothetical protein
MKKYLALLLASCSCSLSRDAGASAATPVPAMKPRQATQLRMQRTPEDEFQTEGLHYASLW